MTWKVVILILIFCAYECQFQVITTTSWQGFKIVQPSVRIPHQILNTGLRISQAECAGKCKITDRCQGFSVEGEICKLLLSESWTSEFLIDGGSSDVFLTQEAFSANGNVRLWPYGPKRVVRETVK